MVNWSLITVIAEYVCEGKGRNGPSTLDTVQMG